MTESEHLAIQKRGANARALGQSIGDNPFYKTEASPRVSGDTIEQWTAKVNAWELGWRAEDLMRA